MKKAALAFLLLCCIIFSACQKGSSHASSFSLEIIDPQTTGTMGESITFTAELNNNAEQEYHLSHGIPLILLYIYPAEATPEEPLLSTSISTVIQPGETISKSIHIELLEEGNYLLKASCRFEAGGESIELEAGPISIAVSAHKPS